MKTYNSQSSTNKKGFSIIEVIISVFVIAVGLVSIIGLIAGSLRESINSRNQTIAANLVQEGVELVRNVRDNNWASGDPITFHYLDDSDDCIIDYGSSLDCTGLNYPLKLGGSGYYNHSIGTLTKFSRRIKIESSGTDKKITSVVKWDGGSSWPVMNGNFSDCTTSNKCVYAQDILTDWKQ